jgi:hypothetical protein
MTCDQSASISSARIIGRDVYTPWPNSSRFTVIKILPSGLIWTKASGG